MTAEGGKSYSEPPNPTDVYFRLKVREVCNESRRKNGTSCFQIVANVKSKCKPATELVPAGFISGRRSSMMLPSVVLTRLQGLVRSANGIASAFHRP